MARGPIMENYERHPFLGEETAQLALKIEEKIDAKLAKADTGHPIITLEGVNLNDLYPEGANFLKERYTNAGWRDVEFFYEDGCVRFTR